MAERKDPVLVAAGRRGALKRWGEPRILRLDELTPPQRRLALALVEAVRKEASPVIETSGEAAEVRRARAEHPTAA